MIIAKQDLVIYGKLFLKNEKITNNIFGKMVSREDIEKKLNEKNYQFEIVNEQEIKTEKKQELKQTKKG